MIVSETTPEKIKQELDWSFYCIRKFVRNESDLVEKGIMLIKFSETFTFYLRYVNCVALMQEFHIILEPSWTGACNRTNTWMVSV